MSIVTSVALALLLAVDPPAAPAAPPESSTEPAAAPAPPAAEQPPAALAAPLPATAAPPAALAVTATLAKPSSPAAVSTTRRQMRAGVGVSVTNANDGFGTSVQAGVQVDPWRLFGFRAGLGMTTGVVGAGGWESAEFSGSAVYRPIGDSHRVTPYLGGGVQFAILAVNPDPTTPPPQGSARIAPGHLTPSFATGSGGGESQEVFGGISQFKVMPELTAGALIRLSSTLELDLAARYLPLNWDGTTYNGLTVSAAICAPF
jgi:hypothetical protein